MKHVKRIIERKKNREIERRKSVNNKKTERMRDIDRHTHKHIKDKDNGRGLR